MSEPSRSAAAPRRTRQRRRQTLGLAAALAPIVVFWLPTVTFPFSGDQALFITAARQLADGAVYYRDFWDVKQPGIYWLYQLAHLLPGPDLLGVRLIDLGWSLATGVLVSLAVTRLTGRPLLRLAAPSLVLGPYLLTAGATGLAQIEAYVGLPLLASTLLATPPGERSPSPGRLWPRLVAAGAAGGAVLVLKAPYVLVLVVLAIAMAARARPSVRPMQAVVLFTIGASVPVALVVGYFAAQGSLGLLWFTTAIEPWRIAAGPALHDLSLYPALGLRAVAVFAATAIPALVALVGRRTAEVLTLAGWAAATIVVAAVQRPSPYQVYALIVPLGLLAVAGLDMLADRRLARRRDPTRRPGLVRRPGGTIAVATLATLLPLLTAAVGVRGAVHAVIGDVQPERNAAVAAAAAALPAEVTSGDAPILVIGDPLWYVELGRTQAVEINGWSPELATTGQWRELERQLRRSRPRAVFIGRRDSVRVEKSAPGILDLLSERYRVADDGADDGAADGAGAGTWWFTDDPGSATPSPEGNRLAESN